MEVLRARHSIRRRGVTSGDPGGSNGRTLDILHFRDAQTPLLKATALYFDKIFLLDPEKATSGDIGIGSPEITANVALLEQHEILERVAPEDVVAKHEKAIANAVPADMADPEFFRLCESSGKTHWTVALAKIPTGIRDDPKYKPTDQSMQRFMGKNIRAVVEESAVAAAAFAFG